MYYIHELDSRISHKTFSWNIKRQILRKMTLQSNTNLMKVADEFADFYPLMLMPDEDQSGPHLHTQETESMFILTVELKGYTRSNIKVESNEDGNRIKISGQKPFQDMLIVGGRVVKKDIEMRGFQKWFEVPKGVIYNQVNAVFNEDDSELVIRMPKVTQGVTGAQVEELKTEEIQAEPTKLLQLCTNEELLEQEAHKVVYDNEDESKDDGEKPKSPKRKFKICTPLIFGSAFVISLVVLVFHLAGSKKQEDPRKKKDQN
ncbi:putative alpha crystallin/Hsp20 domain, HSP20-like chaperone [Helianthus annuus]|uniref:Alpha crystallin/Hsp20 domain, HSP20-like chaperone n=2 Tax=Helianthus annuus TaxID=4232 RepID=A0A251UTR3_HELAN|nr:putative alpha crystallin/Hsp20 domain, HSP20-like chaperone [Helianthus annuus]KAJ0571764.1 putative alpha crystallin/Hsp20 domain, HSP20-like chaperone [Helianthus annuus]KAJ0586139.1 putative alpha crystallin/Hsp20 domain, HSP20-like chaperone [Helianthus annuus]KAJ0748616.1 putative alpha crystallin/Hsp20 domain, HSP20-like chaperone [Helianthus annuus]KAJ0920810.1 putative alpha crystallin/Hsp20 domain, HSP20-like chaperone [Helianthus annuus]